MPNVTGKIPGNLSHAVGGIDTDVIGSNKKINVESQEYYLCRDAMQSTSIHTFKNKTNKQILDDIHAQYNCKPFDAKVNGGDWILCKVAVNDNTKRSYTGTVAEIVNSIQESGSCKVEGETADVIVKEGGKITSKDITCSNCGWSWNKDDSDKEDEYVCHQCGMDNKISEGGEDIVENMKGLSVSDLSKKYSVEELDNLITQLEEAMSDILTHENTNRATKLNELIGKVIDARNEVVTSSKTLAHNNKMEKGGKVIKRADGTYSKHGLWDSIRENAGSGRKPTKEMLEQEAKIKREQMQKGGHIPHSNIELLAPNGNKSNLTEEQWHLVRTPEFISWFGDWLKLAMAKIKDPGMDEVTLANLSKDVSKVVDENMEPLVAFHGSDTKFNSFKLGHGSYSSFTQNKTLAESYGNIIYNVFLDIKTPYIIDGGGGYIWKFIGENSDPDSFFEGSVPFSYDGIIFKNVVDFNGALGSKYVLDVSDVYMVRKNNQIKLADGSNTAFDSNSDDIRYEEGGSVNDEDDEKETYDKWKSLVNMSKSELKEFYDSKEGKEAGLSSSEANKLGINNGRESARWIMRMKETPISKWTPKMWEWANKQISFISRMSGNKGPLHDEKGNKTRKHTSLLIWGHNPEKMNNGGELLKGIKEEKEHLKTAQKLYNHEITPQQAPKKIAMDHLREDENYYTKLDSVMEQGGKIKSTKPDNMEYSEGISEVQTPQFGLGGGVSNSVHDELNKAKSDLDRATKHQAIMKEANAIIRSKKDVTNRLIGLGISEASAQKIQTPGFAGRIGFATYELTNNNANIKRLQDRVNQLEEKIKGAEKTAGGNEERYVFEGGNILVNYEIDRVQIFFDSIPTPEIRTILKGSGWNWSPTNGAWQRKITPQAIYNATKNMKATKFGPAQTESDDVSEIKPLSVAEYSAMLESRKFTFVSLSFYGAISKEFTGDKHVSLVYFSLDKNEIIEQVKKYISANLPGIDIEKVSINQYPKTYIQDSKRLFAQGKYLPSNESPEKVLAPLYKQLNNFNAMQKDERLETNPEPIRELGTGSKVYFETEKYRVNDFKDKYLLNVGSDNSLSPLKSESFDDVNEAVFVAKKLNELAPDGLNPNYHFIEKIIKGFRDEYKDSKNLINVASVETLEPNSPDEFDETIMANIDPKDGWVGNLIKERDVKNQIYKQLSGPEEDKKAEVERIFQLYAKKHSPNRQLHEMHKKEENTVNDKIPAKLITLQATGNEENYKYTDYNYEGANEKMRWLLDNKKFSNLNYNIEFEDGETLGGVIDCEPREFFDGVKNPFTRHLNTFWGNVAKGKGAFMGPDEAQQAKDFIEKYDLGEEKSSSESKQTAVLTIPILELINYLNKEDDRKKKAQMWNERRSLLLPGTGTTLWQLTIGLPYVETRTSGEEINVSFSGNDLLRAIAKKYKEFEIEFDQYIDLSRFDYDKLEDIKTDSEKWADELLHYKNILRNIDKHPDYSKKNVEQVISELENKIGQKPKSDYQKEVDRQIKAGEIEDASQGISLYHLSKNINEEKSPIVEIGDVTVLTDEQLARFLDMLKGPQGAKIDKSIKTALENEIKKRKEGKDEIGDVTILTDDQLTKYLDMLTIPDVARAIGNAAGAKIAIENEIKKRKEGKTTPTESFKGINHNYKNQYELNKNIEILLKEKGDQASNYTSDEKVFIRKYSGYGGLDKYGKTGKGGLFEYYTPREVIEKMWALAYKYGYNDGPILEPSVATGEFFQFAKPGIELVGYEISEYSAMICRILYPAANIKLQPFEQVFIKNNWTIKDNTSGLQKFDLVIGNPPYGDFSVVASRYMTGMGEKDHVQARNYVEYFIRRGIDLLNPGGLLIYIVGAQLKNGGTMFLDSGSTPVKEYLNDHCDFLDAYRLPDSIFERTGVTSEIICLRKK